MATLSAMFKLYDRYSTTITKVMEKTDRATQSILKASKNTDGFNESLKRTDTAASRAGSGLSKLISAVGGLAAVKKTMDLTDTYVNTNARLGLITSSLAEQKALQQDVFAAADRARGNYTEMANAAAKLKMLAGDSFGSNQEAVGFTELLTKSLKISGAGQAEQNSAFLQLTQAMTSGKLQGDEFRSIMENAPMVANAIADYMGIPKSELKELSSQGLITADIIKNAMFSAADDINEKFDEMPVTFGDVWNRIKNTGIEAFSSVFEKMNTMLNSDRGQQAIANLTRLVFIAAGAFSVLLDGIGWAGENMDILAPIILALAGAWLVYNSTVGLSWLTTMKNVGAMGLKAAADWLEYAAISALIFAQDGFNAALAACPVTWLIGGVLLLVGAFYAGVAAVNHFAGTSISATGLIAGGFFALGAFLYNSFIYPILSAFVMLANFIGNVFNDPLTAVVMLFMDMAITCIDYVANMAKTIEAIINKIPGVTVDITSGIDSFSTGLKTQIGALKDEHGWKTYVEQPKALDVSAAAAKGYDAGASLVDKLTGFTPSGLGSEYDFSQFATGGNPATVKGTGKGGAVKVENEEDIDWMRQLAERDYVARISQNTLAPNIRVEFTGPITKEADVDRVVAHMTEQLREVIASAPEGVYP